MFSPTNKLHTWDCGISQIILLYRLTQNTKLTHCTRPAKAALLRFWTQPISVSSRGEPVMSQSVRNLWSSAVLHQVQLEPLLSLAAPFVIIYWPAHIPHIEGVDRKSINRIELPRPAGSPLSLFVSSFSLSLSRSLSLTHSLSPYRVSAKAILSSAPSRPPIFTQLYTVLNFISKRKGSFWLSIPHRSFSTDPSVFSVTLRNTHSGSPTCSHHAIGFFSASWSLTFHPARLPPHTERTQMDWKHTFHLRIYENVVKLTSSYYFTSGQSHVPWLLLGVFNNMVYYDNYFYCGQFSH